MLLKALKITPYLMTCFSGTGNLNKPKLNTSISQGIETYYRTQNRQTFNNNCRYVYTEEENQNTSFVNVKTAFTSGSYLNANNLMNAWVFTIYEITSSADGMKTLNAFNLRYYTENSTQIENNNTFTDVYYSYNQNLSSVFTYFTTAITDETQLDTRRSNILDEFQTTSSKISYEYSYIDEDYYLTNVNSEQDSQLEDNPINISSEQKTYILIYSYLEYPTQTNVPSAGYYYPYAQYNNNYSTTEMFFTNTNYTGQSLEVIDVGGLMFQVLTMPFTFISSAFNLTMFAGTPYQINVSNLFLSIIALLIFALIIQILLGFKK